MLGEWLAVIDTTWLTAFFGILIVDLIMSGDNAVIIAMASRNVPRHQRRTVILWGSMGAVILRIILTIGAVQLLEIPYLQFAGGLTLLWIAVKLLADDQGEGEHAAADTMLQAIKIIVMADVVMSLDNVLALAGVAKTSPHGQYGLLILGLLISLPLVMFGATFLLRLLERWPVIIYIGAGVLGYAAAEMLVADRALHSVLEPFKIWIQFGLTSGVLILGTLLKKRGR